MGYNPTQLLRKINKICVKCGNQPADKDRINCTKCREYHNSFYQRNPRKSYFSARRKQLKDKAFDSYGGYICKSCGLMDIDILTLDHINGGGNKHRKQIHGNLHEWLYSHNYPPGFQVLCFNCNWKKRLGKL